jgi:type III secretion protein HrpB1
MIDPSLQRKEFVSGLVGLISLAIDRGLLDDAEALLTGVRTLRPKMAELDTFEAWIAMQRGYWADAMRTLRSLDAIAPEWSTAKAFLAYCQYVTGDAGWKDTANDVLQNSQSPEALELVRSLLNPEEGETPSLDAVSAPTIPMDLSHTVYMRA